MSVKHAAHAFWDDCRPALSWGDLPANLPVFGAVPGPLGCDVERAVVIKRELVVGESGRQERRKCDEGGGELDSGKPHG